MKNMNIKKLVARLIPVFSVAVLYPLAVFAQATSGDYGCFTTYQNDKRLGSLFKYITCTIQTTVIPLLFAIAMAMFIWGVVQFVLNGDDAEKKDKGRSFMIWGIVGLTVMVGVWGLVKVVGGTFDVNTGVLPQLPNGS